MRYFLHLQYVDELVRDPDGSVCYDLEAAKAEAELGILGIASECLATGRPFRLRAVRICNAQDELLAEVPASGPLSRIFQI